MMQRFNNNMELWKNAISLRAQRHEVLASNIANADTPYYKARDFDFAATMQKAMDGRKVASEGGQLSLQTTSRRHLEGLPGDPLIQLQFHNEFQSAVDENTVEMDVERTKIIDNAVHYQILTRFISDKFTGIKEALAPVQ